MFDPTTEMLRDNYIRGFAYDVTFPHDGDGNDRTIGSRNSDGSRYEPLLAKRSKKNPLGWITLDTDYSGMTIPGGSTITIKWNYDKYFGDMRTVGLKYLNKTTNEEHIITPAINHMFYDWNVIENDLWTDDIGFTIDNESVDVKIHKNPNIKIIPDPKTGKITRSSFIILDPGYFLTNDEVKIPAQLDFIDSCGNIKLSEVVYINVKNSTIDRDNPIDWAKNKKYLYTTDGDVIVYDKEIKHQTIDLILFDALNPEINISMSDIQIV